jgi:ABC-type nitrate/sulfonate/bicarbonate transport system substrate-binding protein
MKTFSRGRTKLAIFSIIVVLVAASVLGAFYLGTSQQNKKQESLTLGLMSIEVEGLIYIADSRGYFSDNGLNVNVKDYVSGLAAVNGLLNGEVNIATGSDFVLAGKVLANKSLVSIGNIDKFSIGSLLVRTDHGINNASDLIGKRIGVALGTVAEYNLERFLDSNGIGTSQVILVNIPPLFTPAALTNGSVDAAYTTKAYYEMVIGPIPSNVLAWNASNDRFTNYLAITAQNWALNHPDTVKRFLQALYQAEQFVISNPADSKEIVRVALNDTDAYVQQVWPENQFTLTLDQSLVLAMEDQTRWMIRSNLTTSPVPDFLNCIYLDGLQAVDPGSVNIIR